MSKIEYAKEFAMRPEQVGAVNLLWWERWKVYRQTQAVRSAYMAAKRYQNLAEAPSSILEAMTWALEKD